MNNDIVTVEMVCAKTRRFFAVEFARGGPHEKYKPVRVIRRRGVLPPQEPKSLLQTWRELSNTTPDDHDKGDFNLEDFDQDACMALHCPHCDFGGEPDGIPPCVSCLECGRTVCGAVVTKRWGIGRVGCVRLACVCGVRGWGFIVRRKTVDGTRPRKGVAGTAGRRSGIAATNGKSRRFLPSTKQRR